VVHGLPADFPARVVVVQHLNPHHRSLMADILGNRMSLQVKQAEEGDTLQGGWAYIAPPAHHTLVNRDGTLSLSQSELVHFVRPSADVLFESEAANAFLASILASVDLGIVVIDRKWQVQLWNERAEDLWGLGAYKVPGRSLLSLDIGLPVEQLREPIELFMNGEEAAAKMELDAVNRRGCKIKCHASATGCATAPRAR
jgi:PAS domain S-box-containing protein